MRIGLIELVVVIILAIALIKPEKLKGLASNLGKALRILKEENTKINKDIVEPFKETMKPITEPIEEVIKPVQEIQNDIKEAVNNTKKDMPSVNLEK